ncbi:alpha/beta fold hydrolase [Paracidovorax anthurii]|uniref:3-oxoadipate enol-lactonase n=1 Tax=Paracidovorax anthurii TaxID=78229 RepID=A0A328ZFI0_9BURK|nr:alpha/beta hydrolase [Paracidovorax anthurii]RAR85130.1 3-oxoadipate enol-lactonase [Paracidovorax anthurii]
MHDSTRSSRTVSRPDADLAVHLQGDPQAPVVFFAHSILSSSAMWTAQADLLAARGWRVVCADTRGHGASRCTGGHARMDTLVADTVAVLDALDISRVHYVGLSLGGMSGFGLALQHPDRLASLCLCDARADAPPEVAAPWDARIATARAEGCAALAMPTLERWFGTAFLQAHPDTAARLRAVAADTTVDGFVACARAIQSLDYLAGVDGIALPTTLVVGEKDGVLPAAMAELAARIRGAALEVIPGAGHLPNIDRREAFDTVLLHHLARAAA